MTTKGATVGLKVPFAKQIPIALDDPFVATGAPGAAAVSVVDVAGIDVVQALRERDLPGARERRRRRVRLVAHLEVRVKRGEVPRDVRPEISCEPFRRTMQFRVAIVFAGNEQRGNLEPYVRLAPQVDERLEHGLELREAEPVIELLSETLEVHVGGVHVSVEFGPRIRSEVARGHGNSRDAELAACIGGVDGVFGEDDGVVVGERDRPAPQAQRGPGDLFRRSSVRQAVPLARLADVPVLAKTTAEIAPGSAKRQHAGARQEMI